MSSTTTQQKLGFKFGRNGAHSARTMMLAELTELSQSRPVETPASQYQQDIELFNVLHKPTEKASRLIWWICTAWIEVSFYFASFGICGKAMRHTHQRPPPEFG